MTFAVIILLLPALIATILGFYFHTQAVWYQQFFGDEIHSLFFLASHTWLELTSTPIEPVHPNGYYIFLKLWHTIIPSVLFLRWIQWIIFILSTIFFVMNIIVLTNNKSAKKQIISTIIWSTSFFVSSAYLWHFQFQLRMYGLGILLILISLLLTLKKKYWQASVIDWLLTSIVYGSVLWILARWSALWIHQILSNKSLTKQKLIRLLTANALSVIPVLFVLWEFKKNTSLIETSFLYWVHIPTFSDWSLALISMISGKLLPYFEGYSNISIHYQSIGMIANFGIFLAIMIGVVIGIFRIILKKKIFTNFLSLLLIATFFLYSGTFLYTLLWGGHIFHIRQLFPIALILWVAGVSFFMQIWHQQKTWLFRFVLTIIGSILLFVNIYAVGSDSLNKNQVYPHHFTSLPGTPLFASISDVELIYKQCNSYSRMSAKIDCQDKNIFLLDEKNNRASFHTTSSQYELFWVTNRVKDRIDPTILCSQISIDYWKCESTLSSK